MARAACLRLKILVALFEGSAVRDRALGILLDALAPDQALLQEEAAQKLEAALYASCTNGRASGPSGQPAEPGVTYTRRLRVLWSWLDSSSPYRSPGLKRLFIEGIGSSVGMLQAEHSDVFRLLRGNLPLLNMPYRQETAGVAEWRYGSRGKVTDLE